MTTTTTEHQAAATSTPTPTKSPIFSALIGISTLAVLLQGLWAGIFLEHDGHRDAASSWIDVHARGADVALLFAALATVYAFWKRRPRKDLWIGGLVFTALIVVESYIGGLIRDDSKDTLTAVHVPLAMAIMALAVWLPLRARSRTQRH
jgi:uncharacterized membrane protein YfcA